MLDHMYPPWVEELFPPLKQNVLKQLMLDHVFAGAQQQSFTTPRLLDPLSPEYPALTRKGKTSLHLSNTYIFQINKQLP